MHKATTALGGWGLTCVPASLAFCHAGSPRGTPRLAGVRLVALWGRALPWYAARSELFVVVNTPVGPPCSLFVPELLGNMLSPCNYYHIFYVTRGNGMWAHLHFCVEGWWTKGGEPGMCVGTAGYVAMLARHVSEADGGWLKPSSYLTPSHSRGDAGGCTPYPLTLNAPYVPYYDL